MTKYLRAFSRRATPQSLPIHGSTQVLDNAGGYAWAIDDWGRLDRFLVLGSEGGTYYVGETKLTRDNAEAVLRCIEADGRRAVGRIVEISESGRAPKQDPAIFALALCSAFGDDATRAAAHRALPRVCRYGTTLLHFAAYAQELRGWGRGLRRAVGGWFNDRPAKDVSYQAAKYQSRDGWALADLLRLAHPVPPDEAHRIAYGWIVDGWPGVGEEPHPDEALRVLWAFERAKRATDTRELVSLIRDYDLPHEGVTSEWKTRPEVWEAMLESMGMTAMVRNLATMTRVGLLAPASEATKVVVGRLRDGGRLRKARVHPIALLSALTTYRSGHSAKGDATWEPVAAIVDALNDAFYASFGSVTPTGKRLLLGLDVSGSMAGTRCAGLQTLQAREACGAMALVTSSVEKTCTVVGFDTRVYPLAISPRQRLDDVVGVLAKTGGGGTDCALPIRHAIDRRLAVDGFVIYTDSETWAGSQHPAEAIREYRRKLGIPAKLVVVAMAATRVTIADPDDAGQLNVVGFDTAAPELIADFLRS